jgi:hypothetical protein
LGERELEQVVEEIYDNEGSELEWSDSDTEQEASVPVNRSSDSSDSDAELRRRVDQSTDYPPCHVHGRTRRHTLRGLKIAGSQEPSDTEKEWKIEGSVRDIPFSSIPGISNASNIYDNLSPYQDFHDFINNDIMSHKNRNQHICRTTNCSTKIKGPISKKKN